MQQTLADCTFCDALSGTGSGKALTWGQDERVTNPICVDCVIKAEPGPDERDHCTCDGCCRLVVDIIAALTRSRVELGHLERSLQLCARCTRWASYRLDA